MDALKPQSAPAPAPPPPPAPAPAPAPTPAVVVHQGVGVPQQAHSAVVVTVPDGNDAQYAPPLQVGAPAPSLPSYTPAYLCEP